jgi:hypothetical protein
MFLKTGLAVGATASLQRVLFLPDAAAETPATGQLSAQMIWCDEQTRIPALRLGNAVGIASSGPGNPLTEDADQHAVFIREFDLDSVPAHASIHATGSR